MKVPREHSKSKYHMGVLPRFRLYDHEVDRSMRSGELPQYYIRIQNHTYTLCIISYFLHIVGSPIFTFSLAFFRNKTTILVYHVDFSQVRSVITAWGSIFSKILFCLTNLLNLISLSFLHKKYYYNPIQSPMPNKRVLGFPCILLHPVYFFSYRRASVLSSYNSPARIPRGDPGRASGSRLSWSVAADW